MIACALPNRRPGAWRGDRGEPSDEAHGFGPVPPSPESDRFFPRLAAVTTTVALALLLWRSIDLVLLGVGALVFSSLLTAMTAPLAKHTPLPRGVALAVSVAILVVLLGAAGALFGYQLSAQVSDVASRLPRAWRQVQAWLSQLPFGDHLMNAAKHLSAHGGQGLASRLTGIAMSLADVVANLVLVVVGGIYLAARPGTYRSGFLMLVPESRQTSAGHAVDAMGAALKKWLLAQAVSMVLVGGLAGLGLWLAGVPSPFALGLLSGLAEFVPLVGPFISAIPSALVALTVSPMTAVWALLVHLAVQQIESNAITPLVQRKLVDIPPVVTLFGVALAGLLFGALGVLLAGPVTVLSFVAVRQLYVRDTLQRSVA